MRPTNSEIMPACNPPSIKVRRVNIRYRSTSPRSVAIVGSTLTYSVVSARCAGISTSPATSGNSTKASAARTNPSTIGGADNV